jgi:enoyl-CoA hydratase/carnithine racemase
VTDLVLKIRRGRVVELRLNRPEQMNALSAQLIAELAAAVTSAGADDTVAALFITAGGRAFSAGADLIEAKEQLADPATFRETLDLWRRTFRALETLPKPVIAVVDGLAIAGGLELALACDLVVATDRAKLGDGHATYGLVPGGGGSQRLPDAIGVRAARWLMYTGALVDAATAHQLGLVQHVLPAAELEGWLEETAQTLSARSSAALAFVKTMTASPSVTDERLTHEVLAAVAVVSGPDAQEGLAAFEAKRPPRFPSIVDHETPAPSGAGSS